VLLIPLLLIMMELLILTGRASGTGADLTAVASEAARAGSLAAGSGQVQPAVLAAGTNVLESRDLPCRDTRIELYHESNLQPGGVVAVEVWCTVRVSDLGFITDLLPINDITMRRVGYEAIDPLRVFNGAP